MSTSIEKEALDNLRKWLSEGATIKATNITEPILEIQSDGNCYGNLTIDFGKK